jgi:CRISPR/Cas system CMR-associated protein Cmr3 (group 5 of RAMP superfamily)
LQQLQATLWKHQHIYTVKYLYIAAMIDTESIESKSKYLAVSTGSMKRRGVLNTGGTIYTHIEGWGLIRKINCGN